MIRNAEIITAFPSKSECRITSYNVCYTKLLRLKLADVVVITKGDIVSQAEREVFAYRVQSVAPRARIIQVNGRSGQGAHALAQIFLGAPTMSGSLENQRLRFPMPAALCSYCLGETRVGTDYQIGQFRKLNID